MLKSITWGDWYGKGDAVLTKAEDGCKIRKHLNNFSKYARMGVKQCDEGLGWC